MAAKAVVWKLIPNLPQRRAVLGLPVPLLLETWGGVLLAVLCPVSGAPRKTIKHFSRA